MKISIVITTINAPTLLPAYLKDFRDYGHSDVDIIVVGDLKTPPGTNEYCQRLNAEYNIPIRYLDPESQQALFEMQYPKLWQCIPWNCGQRRNFGHLLAYREGADFIVALDDDNFLADRDYLGRHLLPFAGERIEIIESETGWYNVCERLTEKNNRYFFPRGYPPGERAAPVRKHFSFDKPKAAANAGLWLGDPDVDAVTRFAIAPDVRDSYFTHPCAPARGTWCPFNSQNTMICRDLLPAWFMSPDVGRYEDIWAGYIATACAHACGSQIAFGRPLVRQKRNPHDLYEDYDAEQYGMRLTDAFCRTLRGIKFREESYKENALCAISALETWAGSLPPMQHALYGFLAGYKIWLDLF